MEGKIQVFPLQQEVWLTLLFVILCCTVLHQKIMLNYYTFSVFKPILYFKDRLWHILLKINIPIQNVLSRKKSCISVSSSCVILVFQWQQKKLLKDISQIELYFIPVSASFEIQPDRFCIFTVGDKNVLSRITGATGKVGKKLSSSFSRVKKTEAMQGKNSAGWKYSKINWSRFLNLWDGINRFYFSLSCTPALVSKWIQRGRITWDWIHQRENFPKVLSNTDTSA